MRKRIALKLQLKDGTSIMVYSCARKVHNGWQGGVKTGDEAAAWYNVFGAGTAETLDLIESKILVDVEEGHLVIVIDAQEMK